MHNSDKKKSLHSNSFHSAPAQIKNKELNHKLFLLEKELKEKIAECLHDEVGTLLTLLRIAIRNIENNNLLENKDNLLHLVDNASEVIKKISKELKPFSFIKLGYIKGIEEYCTYINKTTAINTEFSSDGSLPLIDNNSMLQLFLITRELINNSIKYANPSILNVRINCIENEINTTIQHNGKKFTDTDIKEICSKTKGLGIICMEERASFINAKIGYYNNINDFVQVFINMPV